MSLQVAVRLSNEMARSLQADVDLVICGIPTFAASPVKGSGRRKAHPAKAPAPQAIPELAPLDALLGEGVSACARREDFSGKRDQTLRLQTLGRTPARAILVLGLGDTDKAGPTPAETRAFAGKAARLAVTEKARTVAVVVPAGMDTRLRYLAEGLALGAYRFTKYLTGERLPKETLASATLLVSGTMPREAKAQVALGLRVAAAVNLSRDLSSEPGNQLPPAELARRAQAVARDNHLRAVVFDRKEILRRKMFLIDAVGRGSRNEPRVVHMSYVPAGKAKKKLVFVGKGITFDSGGLCIKPAAGMGEMKNDMSGAGNMVGLMAAVAAVRPPVEVHAIMACAENMPDGDAYRPGDVFKSLDGKTVEIVNTDAEGRLVLADALAYARTLNPDLLVDNATLTGACVVALGSGCSAYYATSEEARASFAAAVKDAGEQMWHMPLLEDLRENLRSDVADLKHTGDRWGGSITAALFLRDFIGDVKHFVHADIAGPVSTERAFGWNPKGATGHGVLTYLALVENAARG